MRPLTGNIIILKSIALCLLRWARKSKDISADKARKKNKRKRTLSDTDDVFNRSLKLNFNEQV